MKPPIRSIAVVASLLIIVLAGSFQPAQAGSPPCQTSPGVTYDINGYWHTDGNRIVDAQGQMVRIAAIDWFGMENRYHVPNGLQKQSLDAIMTRVRGLGFNAVRLSFSNETVEKNPVATKELNANPSLKGLHALTILDRIVAAAGMHGLRIILENHRSTSGDPPEPNGLWYTKQYPESAWINDWIILAKRYQGNPVVVGFDLRNEPHTVGPGPWSLKTYLKQGATWGPYKGLDNKATDWRLAAQRAGNAVLAVNPQLLIIVEGIQQYPDPTMPHGIAAAWWGSILQPARQYPVQLKVPHQLVYSPHEYGPFKSLTPFSGLKLTYSTMASVWLKRWAYLLQPSYAQTTPIFLGEFGTCGSSAKCVSDTRAGSQGLWFQILMRYLASHPEIGWSFWALNGTNSRHSPMTNYVLKPDWKTVRLPALIKALQGIEKPVCAAP